MTAPGRDAFLADELVQHAVVRNFEMIGEAAKRVPDDYRRAHPEIPWRGLAAFRDVLIHRYESVDLLEVWRVVEEQVPALIATIGAALPPLEQLERELAGEPGGPDEAS